jgi:hypothetical protein
MVCHAYIDEYLLLNMFVMVTCAFRFAIGDIGGDWRYSPQNKKNLIAGEFGRGYLPKMFGKPMGEWGLREMLITFARSSILIFASHAELSYLSRLLTIPTRSATISSTVMFLVAYYFQSCITLTLTARMSTTFLNS